MAIPRIQTWSRSGNIATEIQFETPLTHWRLNLNNEMASTAPTTQLSPAALPPSVFTLPQTAQLEALYTIIRNKDTKRGDFLFYSDRIIRLLVEEGLNHLPVVPKTVQTPTVCSGPVWWRHDHSLYCYAGCNIRWRWFWGEDLWGLYPACRRGQWGTCPCDLYLILSAGHGGGFTRSLQKRPDWEDTDSKGRIAPHLY